MSWPEDPVPTQHIEAVVDASASHGQGVNFVDAQEVGDNGQPASITSALDTLVAEARLSPEGPALPTQNPQSVPSPSVMPSFSLPASSTPVMPVQSDLPGSVGPSATDIYHLWEQTQPDAVRPELPAVPPVAALPSVPTPASVEVSTSSVSLPASLEAVQANAQTLEKQAS
jgi:hypothetical protein